MPIIIKKSRPIDAENQPATQSKRSQSWAIVGIVVGVLLLGVIAVAWIDRLTAPPPHPSAHFQAGAGQTGGTGGIPGRPELPEQIRRYGPEFIESERDALYGQGYGNKPQGQN